MSDKEIGKWIHDNHKLCFKNEVYEKNALQLLIKLFFEEIFERSDLKTGLACDNMTIIIVDLRELDLDESDEEEE